MGAFKRWIKSQDGVKTAYWYIRFMVNGKEKWESIGEVGEVTKTVAQARLRERRRQVRLGQLDMIGVKIPTSAEFSREYLTYIKDVKQNRSARRTRQALKHFSLLFGNKKLSEITPEEKHRLLEASPKYLQDIILIALNTGMHQAEILSLKWEWVDLENNLITLPQTNTKSKKTRKIPISPVVRRILLECKIRSGGSEFVFPSPKGLSSHLTWLKHSFKTACKKAGIEKLRFHDLRHTAATRLVESGIPLHAVTKLLGHSSVKVTERYRHPETSIQEAVQILANFTQNRSHEKTNLL